MLIFRIFTKVDKFRDFLFSLLQITLIWFSLKENSILLRSKFFSQSRPSRQRREIILFYRVASLASVSLPLQSVLYITARIRQYIKHLIAKCDVREA